VVTNHSAEYATLFRPNALIRGGGLIEDKIEMLKKLDKAIIATTYLYLLIPILLFIGGWLKLVFSIPLILITLAALYLSLKDFDDYIELPINRKNLIKCGIIFVVLAAWVIFSGIGGFSYQNEDHHVRNAVLHDLITFDWPVIFTYCGSPNQSQGALIYYLAFWLPAALYGKFFGFFAANLFLYIWTLMGVVLFFYLLSRYIKKVSFFVLWTFMFWSGLDFPGHIIKWFQIPSIGKHIEWWAAIFQYSSNTTALYWVFNQAIAPWLILALTLNNKNLKNILFIYSMCFLYAPFSCIGLAPFIAVIVLFKNSFSFNNIKGCISIQNLVAAPLIILIALLYYMSNSDSLGNKEFFNVFENFNMYFIFIFLEVLLFLILIFHKNIKNPIYYVTLAILVLLPFYKAGGANDFVMRVSLPALMMLMIMVIQYLSSKDKSNNALKFILIFSLLIGSITPFNEIYRSVENTIKNPQYNIKDDLKSLSALKNYTSQFISFDFSESFFFKYLSPVESNKWDQCG
jgi:hypothetical protein